MSKSSTDFLLTLVDSVAKLKFVKVLTQKKKLSDTKLDMRQPFLGYRGSGARLKVALVEDGISIRETLGSQLGLLFLLAVIGFYPFWILLFKNQEIHGGVFGRSALGVASVLGILFFAKYFIRMLKAPKIDVHRSEQKVLFYKSAKNIDKVIHFSTIAAIECIGSNHTGRMDPVDLYSLTIIESSNIVHCLCMSDSQENIKAIVQKLDEIIPGVVR